MANRQNSVPDAGDCATPERTRVHWQADRIEFFRNGVNVSLRHIDNHQILREGRSKLTACERIRQFSRGEHLFRRDAASQDRPAYVKVTGLLLRVHADVVAENVFGLFFRLRMDPV